MSNIQQFNNLIQVVQQVQPQFDKLAKIHGAVNYERESSFAVQILKGNEYLAGIAMGHQDSLKNAVINVAAIGLSLSPVHRLAYLVPRDKKVCLDISYLGLIKLATDLGAIMWAVAEIVRKKDVYKFQGLGKEPLHEFNPFDTEEVRGEIIGAYCTVKLPNGDFLTTNMSIAEIYGIRNRSQSFSKNPDRSPWKSDESEMIKKTVIKRAYKSWPMTSAHQERFDKAIDVTNTADPVDFSGPAQIEAKGDERAEHFAALRKGLEFIGRAEEAYIKHLGTVNNRKIEKLEDLTDIEIEQAQSMMNGWIETKRAKDAKEVESKPKEEVANEPVAK